MAGKMAGRRLENRWVNSCAQFLENGVLTEFSKFFNLLSSVFQAENGVLTEFSKFFRFYG